MTKRKEGLMALLDTKFGQELGKELAKTVSEVVLTTVLKHNLNPAGNDQKQQENLKRAARQAKQALHDLKNNSPYRILGVTEDADSEVIKAAYKAKAKKLHPDRPTGSAEKMAEINEAYHQICKAKGIKP